MGNNPPTNTCTADVDVDRGHYQEKKFCNRAAAVATRRVACETVTNRRRTNSVRRSASLRKQKSRALRRNWLQLPNRKASHLARLEQELRMAEDQRVLFQAAARGDVEAVQQLVDSGVDANITDENKMTALHHASMHARDGVIKALIDRGADVNASDLKGGFSPLHWVVINADPQMGSTDHVDESIVALARGGCDLNCTDFNFATPLHIAAQTDNHVCISTLIRLGADPNRVDITGRNCIKVARSAETKELIKKLKQIKEEAVYHVLEMPPPPPPSTDPPSEPPPPPPPKHIYHVLEMPTPNTKFEPLPPPLPDRNGHIYHILEALAPSTEAPPPTPPRRRKAWMQILPDTSTPPPTPPRRRKPRAQNRISKHNS